MSPKITFLGLELWEEDDDEIDADISLYPNIPPQDIQESTEDSSIVKWIVFLVFYFQTKFSLTD